MAVRMALYMVLCVWYYNGCEYGIIMDVSMVL